MSDRQEIERRVVQPSEFHDTLAEVETAIKAVDTDFVRITVAPVTAEKHKANEAFVNAVRETDVCLGCGEPIDEGGFCGIKCLTEGQP
jgi:predicted aldo/keto reductase-like oxidoreductase